MRQAGAVLMDRQNAPNPQQIEPFSALHENGQLQRFQLPDVPDHYGSPFIPLNVLLDFAIQQSFHELNVLSELLPKKKENERKISVAQFAHSTRCVFLKLLALVKWLRQTRKFEITNNMCFYLDQGAFEFVESADVLSHIRDELSNARMPIFPVAHAVDSLSLGTCIRLPQCIRKRFVPESALRGGRRAQTLFRLNQIIQFRLIRDAPTIPAGYSVVEVKNGMAIFTVRNEFEVTLTLLGDSVSKMNWCLLHIKVLVNDYDVGLGSPLVHPIQVNFLHEMCQHKMKDAESPLNVLYDVLHEFCLRLQLDVLYCQALYLSRTISPRFLTVQHYEPRKGQLRLLYWAQRRSFQKGGRRDPQRAEEYRIDIGRNLTNSRLAIRHSPPTRPLPALFNQAGEMTSVHRLVSETVLLRCRERLDDVHRILTSVSPAAASESEGRIQHVGTAAVRLVFNFMPVTDGSDDESLHVALNSFTGDLLCTVPVLSSERADRAHSSGAHPELQALEAALQLALKQVDRRAVRRSLQRLQVKLLLKRLRAAIPHAHFRVVYEPFVRVLFKDCPAVPPDRMCMQFVQELRYYLVVGFEERADFYVQARVFLSHTNGARISVVDVTNNYTVLDHFSKKPDLFDRNLYDLAQLICDTQLDTRSRRAMNQFLNATAEKLVCEKMVESCNQLKVRARHTKYSRFTGYEVHLDGFAGLDKGRDNACFMDSLAHVVLRQHVGRSVAWSLDMAICEPPLVPDRAATASAAQRRGLERRRRCLPSYQALPAVAPTCMSASHALAAAALERVRMSAILYQSAKRFSFSKNQRANVTLLEYDHHRIQLAYGPDHNHVLQVQYRPKLRNFHFWLVDGVRRPSAQPPTPATAGRPFGWNPHIIVQPQLQDEFTRNRDLIALVDYLQNTHAILLPFGYLRHRRFHALPDFDEQLQKLDLKLRKRVVAELKLTVSAITATRIRIQLGVCHVEFQLLRQNTAGVEGTMVKDRRNQHHSVEELPFFGDFLSTWNGSRVRLLKGEEERKLDDERLMASPGPQLSPYNHVGGPPSAPSRTETHTPTNQNRPNSVAGVYYPNSPANGSHSGAAGSAARTTRVVAKSPPSPPKLHAYHVAADLLDKILRPWPSGEERAGQPSPLEQYLYAVNVARALGVAWRDCGHLRDAVQGVRRTPRANGHRNGDAAPEVKVEGVDDKMELDVPLD